MSRVVRHTARLFPEFIFITRHAGSYRLKFGLHNCRSKKIENEKNQQAFVRSSGKHKEKTGPQNFNPVRAACSYTTVIYYIILLIW